MHSRLIRRSATAVQWKQPPQSGSTLATSVSSLIPISRIDLINTVTLVALRVTLLIAFVELCVVGWGEWRGGLGGGREGGGRVG